MPAFCFEELLKSLGSDDFWRGYLIDNIYSRPIRASLHLAVFIEPFLSYVLDGTKTVESRFSINECPPFGDVKEGDILLLKQAGGLIVGLTQVSQVWSYHIDQSDFEQLRSQFGKAMCAENSDFWQSRENATCVTLMQLTKTRRINGIRIDKRDRRGWVVLRERSQQLALWDDF